MLEGLVRSMINWFRMVSIMIPVITPWFGWSLSMLEYANDTVVELAAVTVVIVLPHPFATDTTVNF